MTHSTAIGRFVATVLAGLLLLAACATEDDTEGADTTEAAPPDGPYTESPWWPYLQAHMDDESPRDVLGGPITVEATQEEGTVNWVLPGPRKLDPTIFGTADDPRGTEKPGPMVGVPEAARETLDDGSQVTAEPVPFSDNFESVSGSLEMSAVDITATDAATTKDRLEMTASFTSPDGHDYEVVASKVAPHGWINPTGGGVITNFIQHGVTGWGTRLMPTEYSDLSWYGVGDIFRDGEKIAENRPMHGMLTEFVRGEGYTLVDDSGVNPGGRHFHLFVFPFDPFGRPDPLPSGFELPNGQDQPFLHIMYPGVAASAGPVGP
ncbi:MAG: hypothetical protein WD627_00765 [Actinomycetota bacterium]